jgi:poly(3-hydroxybutyrate) depolymerase
MTVKASLSVGLLGKAKKSGKDMAAESIEKILCAYPELSADWLLTGRGNMTKETDEKPAMSDTGTVMQLVDTIRQQAQEIGQLKERITQLESSGGQSASDADSETVAHAV